jgi:hypothetical protein
MRIASKVVPAALAACAVVTAGWFFGCWREESPPEPADVQAIIAHYAENPSAGDRRWAGRTFVFSGVVTSVRLRSADGLAVVWLEAHERVYLSVFLAPAEAEKVTVGRPARLIGYPGPGKFAGASLEAVHIADQNRAIVRVWGAKVVEE